MPTAQLPDRRAPRRLPALILAAVVIAAASLLAGCDGGESAGRTVLDLSSLPATGQVLPAGSELLYEITGVVPGTTYRVSTSAATPEETELFVYSDSGFSADLCNGATTSRNEACGATPTSDSLFIRINNFDGLSTVFTLDVTVGFTVPALAFGSADLPATGRTVPPHSSTHFAVTGLAPGSDYIPSISGINDIDLWVYRDPGFIDLFCGRDSVADPSESCIATAAATSIYVVASDITGLGDTFTLDVIASPYISVVAGNLPYSGSVDTTETLIRVTGLAEFTIHTVSLTGLSDDAVLRVWSDPLRTMFQCLSDNPGASDESCFAFSPGNFTFAENTSELYIQVDGSLTSSGTPFSLDVTP